MTTLHRWGFKQKPLICLALLVAILVALRIPYYLIYQKFVRVRTCRTRTEVLAWTQGYIEAPISRNQLNSFFQELLAPNGQVLYKYQRGRLYFVVVYDEKTSAAIKKFPTYESQSAF